MSIASAIGRLFGVRQQPLLESSDRGEPTESQRKFMGFRMLAGARTDRLSAGWGSTPIPADGIIRRQQRVLVARSRERAIGSDYGKRFVQLVVQNVVGDQGVTLQAQVAKSDGSQDTDTNDAIERAWRRWGKRGSADVTGRDSWRAVQEACIRSACTDGEFFVRFVIGDTGGPSAFALQILDAQRCPVDHDVEGLPGGAFVRSGIEFNRFGRPTHYLFTTLDESEASPGYWYGARGFVRVPASEILHGFIPELVGQKRGLPWLSSAIYKLKHLGEYEAAAVVNARIAASTAGFIEWDEGFGPVSDEDDEFEFEVEVEEGMYRELPSGAHVKPVSAQFPHSEFAIFNKSQLRGIAAGLGVSYHTLAQDLEGVNFSSARAGELSDRDHWKKIQTWLIEQLVEPVYLKWLEVSLLRGDIVVGGRKLPAARFDDLSLAAWQPRRWPWVDPRADVDASIKSKNNLFSSPSQLIREQGRDPHTVWREVAADIEAMRAAGIPDDVIAGAVTNQVGRKTTQGTGSEDDSAA